MFGRLVPTLVTAPVGFEPGVPTGVRYERHAAKIKQPTRSPSPPNQPQGLAYGLSVAEAIVAPAMPSSTARAGGIFMPIIASLAHGGGSEPGEHKWGGTADFSANCRADGVPERGSQGWT